MRRYLAVATLVVSALLAAAPTAAQSEPGVGDQTEFEAEFSETDGACGFENYEDIYIASYGEDAQGVYVDVIQPSTADSGRLRLDENGDPIIVPVNTDESWSDLSFVGDVLLGEYSYFSAGCLQRWKAALLLPSAARQYLIGGQAAPPTEETPPPTEETAPPTEETPPPTEATAPPTEATVPPTEATTQETEGAQEPVSTSDDSGFDLLIWLLVAALIILFSWGLFWYFFQRPKRLYRFDRGDAGEYIDDEDGEIVDGLDLPTFGDLEEADQVFLPPRGEDIPDEKPPANGQCDKSHERWRESVDRLARLEQEADDRIGSDDAQPERHARMIEQARESMERWRDIYDECLEAHPDEQPETPSQPGGSPSQPADDSGGGTDPGGETEPGDEIDSGPPGVIIPPPPPPSEPSPKPDCVDGSSKVIVDSEKTFTVAGGNITILGAGRSALFGGKGISGADISALGSSDLEEIFEDIEAMGSNNSVTVTIPTTLLTIKCIRVMHCQNGAWVETDRSRVEESAAGPSRSARWRSQEKRRSSLEVTKLVLPIIEELKAQQAAADAFSCE